MLKNKNIPYSDLYLDPNNPRLAQNFSSEERVPDEAVEGCQEEVEALFKKDKDGQKCIEFTDIKDLKNSMRQIGFVGIQNIIVRELPNQKYLVIEGNRRVAAIRALLSEHEAALPGSPEKIDDAEKLKSLQTIPVMVLQTEGLSEEEIQKQIKTTLGLRHIGGHLEWEPLPKGNNIYTEYMKQLPEGASFEWDAKIGAKIADILAISRPQVRSSLQGYLAYTQMGRITTSVRARHYSLILACVTNTNLKGHEFITMEDGTFALGGDSANRIIQICEFEERDGRDGKENILRDPKAVNRLGLILKDSKFHKSNSIKDYAAGLFQEVLDKGLSLEEAHTALTAFKKGHRWVQEIEKLIKKQEEEPKLSPENFINLGMELELKAKLQTLIRRFIVQINMNDIE